MHQHRRLLKRLNNIWYDFCSHCSNVRSTRNIPISPKLLVLMRSSFEIHSMVCLLSDISALKSLDARLHLRELQVSYSWACVCGCQEMNDIEFLSSPNVDPILVGNNNNNMAKNSKSLSNRKEFLYSWRWRKKISPSHRRIYTHTWRAASTKRANTRKHERKTIIIVKIRIENRFETAGSEKRAVLCVA